MRVFKALVVVALLGGLVFTLNPGSGTSQAETPMMVKTPAATL